MLTFSDYELARQLEAKQAFWNVSAPTTIHLFTNAALTPSDDTPLSSFAEPTFCGYAPVPITWPNSVLESEPDEWWQMTSAPVKFCQTCEEACQTVYGYFVTDNADHLIFSERLWPAGIQFCHACDCVSVIVTITEAATNPGPH